MLRLEQELELFKLKEDISKLTEEEAKQALLDAMKNMKLMQNSFAEIIAKEWGL